MKSTLSMLGFKKVRVFNNLCEHEILEKLEEIKNKNHKDADCLCVVVLTHGSEGYLLARDKSYKVKKLWEPFTADNCPSLAGKPKLFIIQVRFSSIKSVHFKKTVARISFPSKLWYIQPKSKQKIPQF